MKIKNLTVEGYKNLAITLVHQADIIALIGNNGSGKSNLLEALSLIFRSLYKKNETVAFDYTIEYLIRENINVKIEKSRNKIVFTVNDVRAVSIDEYLPKKVVAIYSGEEQRLWNNIFFPVYEEFIKGINQTQQTGIVTTRGTMPQMLYLNRYYWHLSLLTLLISNLDDNQKFILEVLNIKSVEKIKFDFNKTHYKNYASSPVLQFIELIDKKSEYTLAEFKELTELLYSESDIFNYLYIANSPKDSKIIDNITIIYNEHLKIEDFSEGEKKLLLIKAAFEFAEQEDSLFILDEPDAHIHLNNKEQIIKTFSPYKDKRQIVLTTHSPTVTQAIDDDNCLFMVNSGKIIERKKQEIINDIAGEFWNKHQQSSFLSSQKKLILLVEGKHDKLHITNAYEKLKDEFPNLDFDIFSLGGEGKIHPFMNGLYEANIQTNVKYIGVYDNDNAGISTIGKAGFEPDTTNCGYRKLKKDKFEHNNFFAFLLIKPSGYSRDCTIENMFDSGKYEDAYKDALNKSLGSFSNKSIDDINKDIKETSKNILAENSKNFSKEDFSNFRALFKLITEINGLNSNTNVSTTNRKPNLEEAKVKAIELKEKLEEPEKSNLPVSKDFVVHSKFKRSGKTVSEAQHLKGKSTTVKKMYQLLKEDILQKEPTIVVDSKVEYIAFKRNKKNIFDIKILDKKIILWVNKKKGELHVMHSGLFQDCSGKGHHGNGDFEKHFISEGEVKAFVLYGTIEAILKL